MRRLLAELQRRNVFRAGVTWLVATWVVLQVVNNVSGPLGLPAWFATLVIVIAALGLPVTLVVAWLFELTPEGIKLTTAIDPAESLRPTGARRLDRVLIVVLAAAVGVLLVERLVVPAERSNVSAQVATPVATSPVPAAGAAPSQRSALPNSVAVLPLENLSPRPDDAYVAAGIHEEILNQLAKLKALNVIARTSVLRYADGSRSASEIGNELNVEAVLEGSVRYSGERIRVTTQLVSASTNVQLWSETYDRAFADIFAVESDIAANVARALQAELTREEQARLARVPTRSTEAYAYYLRAQQQLGTMDERLVLLDLALSLDPGFALAHGLKAAFLSNALFNAVGAAAVAPAARGDLERRMREHIGRALDGNPEEFSAHYALGTLEMAQWHWRAAREAFERGIATATIPASLYQPLVLHAIEGRHDDALRLAERARDLEPGSAFGYLMTGIAHGYAHRYDAAAADLRRSVELEPVNPLQQSWLAFVETARGDPAALAELQRAERLLATRPVARLRLLPELAQAYAKLGRAADAARLFAEIELLGRDQDLGAGGWAQAYIAIGDLDRALAQLNVAARRVRNREIDSGFINLMDVQTNLLADPVLEQPAFVAVRAALMPRE